MGKTTEDDIRTDLERLPTGSEAYNQAYEDAMKRIEEQDADGKKLAKQVLAWITGGKRPLNTVELQHALAVEARKPNLNGKRKPHIEDMVSVCYGLVTVDKESNIIRLIHYTTQEYFKRTRKYWFPNAEADITTTCITYLSFSVFESGFCQTDNEFEERLRSNPLYHYAARNWGHHARSSTLISSDGVMEFLHKKAQVEASTQALIAIKPFTGHSEYSQEFPRQVTGLHLTAYFGLQEAANVLLATGKVDVDAKDNRGRTPLWWAAKSGHEAVVKLLLDTGKVDADSKDKDGQTPLWWAAANGHEAVVKLLLETGKVDADSKDKDGQTPLWLATTNGHEAVVKLLLDTGKVDADLKGDGGWTPLWWAATNGHKAVVKLLLLTGKVDADSKGDGGWTPLSWAATNGHEAVVKLLLATGKVDADSKDKDGRTPLSWATENRHEAVVKLLLDTGKVDADSKDVDDRTPLSWATENGHEAVVKLLLDTGKVDADSKDHAGRTPFWWAAANGHVAVAKLLLKTGKVSTDSKDSDDGRTPLWRAAENGHEAHTHRCDVCDVSEPVRHYNCNKHVGGYDICMNCYEAGNTHCSNSNHAAPVFLTRCVHLKRKETPFSQGIKRNGKRGTGVEEEDFELSQQFELHS
jgi:ankyrin repeat protein